jgi:cell division protein FtsZ
MRFAEAGIAELLKAVDTLLVIPNQNLFRVANEKTTFTHAFALADQVLYSGVACISDLGQRFLGSNHIRRRRRVCMTKCG